MNELHTNDIALGSGQPVILVHGMAASLRDWTEIAPALAANGYSTHALDLLGHGNSAKPDNSQAYQFEALYHHFREWVESLNLDTPPILIGHSLGGYLSLLHALRFPTKVRGLVLIDPYFKAQQLSLILRLVRRRPSFSEKVMRVTPHWMIHTVLGWNPESNTQISPKARQQIAADYKRASPHFVYLTHEMPDLTNQLSQVSVPALIIWGERDLTLQPASFPQLVKALPNAWGHPIRTAGHQPHISHPELVVRLTLEFINKLNSTSSPHTSSTHEMNRSHFAWP